MKNVFCELKAMVEREHANVDEVKNDMKHEIERVSEMKTAAQNTLVLVKFDDFLREETKQSTQKLVELCNAYLQKTS